MLYDRRYRPALLGVLEVVRTSTQALGSNQGHGLLYVPKAWVACCNSLSRMVCWRTAGPIERQWSSRAVDVSILTPLTDSRVEPLKSILWCLSCLSAGWHLLSRGDRRVFGILRHLLDVERSSLILLGISKVAIES